MRDEMLKRLDEILAYQASKVADEWGPFDDESPAALIQGWAALRAELAAERCENCAHWGAVPNRGHARCASLDDAYTHRDFCCSHFTKKGPTP